MRHDDNECAIGKLEQHLGANFFNIDARLDELEQHFNEPLKIFAANLEKLHERDPPTTGT
jgi:hypothetical protein